jgi:hypothetical protein
MISASPAWLFVNTMAKIPQRFAQRDVPNPGDTGAALR